MKIENNSKNKSVVVWLTSDENKSQEVQVKLRTLYKDCNEQKKKVAVFISGTGDLLQLTDALLLHNKK